MIPGLVATIAATATSLLLTTLFIG
jgi:hypothetical protein